MKQLWIAALCGLIAVTEAPSGFAQAPKPAEAQPDTPATRQAMAFLQAMTTDDEANFLKFVADNAKATGIPADRWRDIRPNLLKLKFHAVTSGTPTEAEVLVYDGAREGWARLMISVAGEPPYGITRFGLRLAKRPEDVPAPPKLAPQALAAATKARAETMAAEDAFSGAILVAKDGKPIFQEAYGLADRAAKTPNTLQTQFRFGSMGKMFTAVSIMQLAEAGKLDLKAPIGRYLSDYPNADIATKVTVENLITHTGGTGDIFGPQFTANRLTLRDAKDYVALYGARGPQFAPGTSSAYSNYGFMLLGRIVEVVSGQSYDDYVAQHIFAPAHMTGTGMAPETTNLPHRAAGYMGIHRELKDAADTLPWRGTPAGGGYSTVGDMLAFANALQGHRLMNAASLVQLTTGGIRGTDGTFYRYDFTDQTPEGRRFWGHGGGAPGMNGDLRMFPDSGYVVVVLANRDPPVAQTLAGYISDRLP
jgi:D-alanyl-D-alanine carboxypeptidase